MLGREPPSREPSACAALCSRFPHRVLLAVPDVRHIPTFAMAAEKARAPFEWARLEDLDVLSAIVSRDTAERLQEGRYGAHRVIDTRTRLDRQTALYAPWCVFTVAGHIEAFECDHPHLGMGALSARAEAALREAQVVGTAQPDGSLDALCTGVRALNRLRCLVATLNHTQPSSSAGP